MPPQHSCDHVVYILEFFCSQSAAAAASSTALAEALLARTKRSDGGDSGSGRHAAADDGKRLHPSSWTETRDSVNTSIGLADSYTEMILVRLRCRQYCTCSQSGGQSHSCPTNK